MRVDMHIHSVYSPDGTMEVKEIVKIARKIGLDAVAITDHNTVKAHLKSEKYDILIIPGIEVSTAQGHVLVYGVREKIPAGKSIVETAEIAHSLGGIVIAAHPYRFWSGIGEKNVVENAEVWDAIEVKNSRCKKKSNMRAKALAEKLGKGMSAGSDAHYPREIGLCYVEVNASTAEDILEEIVKGNAKVFGKDRSALRTLNYVKKAVGEWIGRGFKRI